MGRLRWVVALALASALVAGGAGCSKRRERPSPRWPDPPAAVTAAASAPAASASTETVVCSARPTSVEAPSVDPEGERAFLASLGEGAAPLVPQGEPTRVTKLGLESTARAEAIVGDPAPGLVGAALREGERASMPVSIAAGVCVTYVAHGGLGAAFVDAYLTTPTDRGSGSPPRIIAGGRSLGSIAVIGGRAGCVRSPKEGEAWSGELHVRMRRGAGLVLVQTYPR